MQHKFSQGFLTVPVAIIIAGFIVGLSVIYAVGRNSISPQKAGALAQAVAVAPKDAADEPSAATLDAIRPVDASDHVSGDVNAPVKLIEYSDTECPFCKRFHGVTSQVLKEYAGRVAVVFRFFPLKSLHARAFHEAEALECAAAEGGNKAFSAYIDRLFVVTPSNDGLDPSELPNIARAVGLNEKTFTSCLSSGKYASHIDADYENALAIGGQGTPYSVVIARDGKTKYPINGALSYPAVKAILDQALQ